VQRARGERVRRFRGLLRQDSFGERAGVVLPGGGIYVGQGFSARPQSRELITTPRSLTEPMFQHTLSRWFTRSREDYPKSNGAE